MNLRLPPHRRLSLLVNLLDPRRLSHSAVNCVWALSCLCFSCGCSAKWEEEGQDTTLPMQVRGEEVLGAEVPGEAECEAFPPEASPRVEVEAFRVLECEVEAVVVAQDALINA
jgi:hypothetical protein